ncbi:MAG: hypothetical protein K0R38_919 [Polyangiaceae bacterium]|jgi:hypothetical protein|nr:hypothetical protein [Polyangiaceae bacterium]
MKVWTALGVGCLLLGQVGCVGTTGGELFELEAYGAGASDADGSLRFSNGRGYDVQLDEARLFVGGLYLNRSRPASVSSDTSCTLAGIYVAQVLSGREIDLLSATPQPFPAGGFATSEPALSGEVWLARGDVNQTGNSAPVLRVRGHAERAGQTYPFEGALSIGTNRIVPATDPALPGQHPLCKQRIVSPIPTDLAASAGQSLLLRVDARGMFANVDFATLSESGDTYVFSDASGDNQASDNLYAGLRRAAGVYSFSWLEQN